MEQGSQFGAKHFVPSREAITGLYRPTSRGLGQQPVSNLLKSVIGQRELSQIDSKLFAALVSGVLYLLEPGSIVLRSILFPLVVEDHGQELEVLGIVLLGFIGDRLGANFGEQEFVYLLADLPNASGMS